MISAFERNGNTYEPVRIYISTYAWRTYKLTVTYMQYTIIRYDYAQVLIKKRDFPSHLFTQSSLLGRKRPFFLSSHPF